MQRIAEVLKVSREQIGRDLICTHVQIKRPRTASNPRVAGRPKGRTPKRNGVRQIQRAIDATPEEWEAFKRATGP
jgi:hypothetical protein